MTDDDYSLRDIAFAHEDMTTVYVADADSLEQLADKIEDGTLTADRFELQVGDRTIGLEAEDGNVVGTIVQEQN